MKKNFLAVSVLLVSIFFTACSSDDDVIDRLRTISDIPVSANASVDYLPINLLNIPVETGVDVKKAIENELGTDEAINQVKDIELDDMAITLVSADDQDNFDFIESVTLGVRTDNQEYLEVARLDEVPTGQTVLDLNTTETYIDEYVKSDTLKLVVQFESTEDANNLKLEMNMEFDAKLDPSL